MFFLARFKSASISNDSVSSESEWLLLPDSRSSNLKPLRFVFGSRNWRYYSGHAFQHQLDLLRRPISFSSCFSFCCMVSLGFQTVSFLYLQINTGKNPVISPNLLVWKFCGNAQFPHSFGRFTRTYAETVFFHRISTPGN